MSAAQGSQAALTSESFAELLRRFKLHSLRIYIFAGLDYLLLI